MFHKEFYPTPDNVIQMMDLDVAGKTVYEPHGGKADIIKYCINNGAYTVYASEINDDLRAICSKYASIIGTDFFSVKSEQISDVQLIVMNPPFSNADKHIMHAWNIAPEGCEIVSLCNHNTVNVSRGFGRSELQSIIQNYGSSENLGDCFATAERSTGVEIGLIRLFKPIVSEEFDFDGFFLEEEDEVGVNGIMQYNEIRAIVNTYIGALKTFDKFERVANEFNSVLTSGGLANTGKATFQISRDKDTLTKEVFMKELQIASWNKIFNQMNMGKYVTSGVMKDINKFISSRKTYPFTMRNVYRMIDIIIGTSGNIMNRAIIEAIDNMTMYTHENRYGVEGWKTNLGHLLNKKFIVNNLGNDYNPLTMKTSGSNVDRLLDLFKGIAYITGVPYNESIYSFKFDDFNTWKDFYIFECKIFKKGTVHFKFKNIDHWGQINRAYAKAKGVSLPERI